MSSELARADLHACPFFFFFFFTTLHCVLCIISVCVFLCSSVCVRVFAHAQVHEAVRCHNECGQYEWRAESWSICTINTVDDLPACGEGVQSRKIRSVSGSALADCAPGTATQSGRRRLATVTGTHTGHDAGIASGKQTVNTHYCSLLSVS